LDTFVIFEVIAQSKQSPKRQKFAQSGHPAIQGCNGTYYKC
jgi:hypothetical protein